MIENAFQDVWEDESAQTDVDEKRYGTDRRKKSASGFTCVSIVGWICRREQTRRKGDPEIFCDYE